MKAMPRFITVIMLLSAGFIPCAADDCLCRKIPMYQVSDTQWFHYSVVYNLPSGGNPYCVEQYPTGYIGSYAANEECGNLCGNCLSLGGAGLTTVPDLHFTSELPEYSDIAQPNNFKQFLITLAGGSAPLYEEWTFSEPRAISLKRPNSTAFYAIVWKMKSKDPKPAGSGKYPQGYIGVEIKAPPANVPVIPVSGLCNAVVSAKNAQGQLNHSQIRGLLKVTVDVSDTAIIRLNKASNSAYSFPICPPARGQQVEQFTSNDAPLANSGSTEACWGNYSCQGYWKCGNRRSLRCCRIARGCCW